MVVMKANTTGVHGPAICMQATKSSPAVLDLDPRPLLFHQSPQNLCNPLLSHAQTSKPLHTARGELFQAHVSSHLPVSVPYSLRPRFPPLSQDYSLNLITSLRLWRNRLLAVMFPNFLIAI